MTFEIKEKTKSRIAPRRVMPRMSEGSDQRALTLLREHDERGFDLAYARYAQRIFGFLLRLTRSRTLAEDLFQHTFWRLAERGPSLHPSSNLCAWLFSVARNAYHSHTRALATASRVDWPPVQNTTGAEVEASLVLNDLEAALARLAATDRELLLLLGAEGLAQAEVAVMLDIDPMTLRKRLSRARARLAAALDDALVVESKSKVGQ